MRDLQTLRQRVSQADQHFKLAEEDRQRESASLTETWDSLQRRFDEQQQEIARYRSRIDTLVEANDELAGMIDHLVAIIEESAKRAKDETVPRISKMARTVLTGEQQATGRVTSPGRSTFTAPPPPAAESEDDASDEIGPDRERASSTMSSPAERGVRTLIERIGGVVSPSSGTAEGEGGAPEDTNGEVQDIETLRGELDGLRDRIGAGGRN